MAFFYSEATNLDTFTGVSPVTFTNFCRIGLLKNITIRLLLLAW